jgi:PAS domain S-box-containing protein
MATRSQPSSRKIGDVLEAVADALSDGLWSVDDKGCVIYANATLARMLRTTPEEMVGRSSLDFVFEEDRELALKHMEIRKRGLGERVDFRLRAVDGTSIWTHNKTSLMTDESGAFLGAVAIVQQVVTPEEATEARALATAIVDSSDDAIITKSLDGVIRSWNRGAEKIFGYTAREAVGQPILILLPKGREAEEAEIQAILRSGKLVDHFETIRRRKDGSMVDVSVTISPLFDATGSVIGASKVARDITDQKHIAEERNHLASIIQSSDDAIVSKTTEGIIESWNRGAERIFGYSAEEVIGKPIMIIVPPDRKYEEVDILARICRGEKVDHFETVRMRKDGSYVEVSVTISPILNSNGDIVGASKVARDITDQKHTNEKMHKELEKLVAERTIQYEKANKELEGFTYSVSHDLRGPLRSIVSSCMILREDFGPNLPAEAQEELSKQAKAAKRMADLIDDLLKLSRLGRQEMRKADLDITEIAREVASDLVHAGSKCEIHVKDGLKVYGDQPTIKLLLTNLMENACKFSNHAGPVEVGQEGDAIFVRDAGIGFDQQYAEKMFLPFERLVLDRDYPGTGIGLANVKRVIDRHGGKVWAVSDGLGKGATLYFALPRAPAA